MSAKEFGKRNWWILILFGLIGQIAWSVENMYFNLFVFEKISPDLDAVTLMVQLSGIVATVTTLIAGTLSDKTGNRRRFISYGYLIWGFTVALFGFLGLDNLQKFFDDQGKAIVFALTAAVVGDCVMTVFGSTANDAAFNAWVTDNTREEFRGKVEGVLSILPLIAMLIVAGGFGILVEIVGYQGLFIGLGAVITLCGAAGIFVIQDSPTLEKKGALKDIVYGFKPSVVKGNPALYVTLCLVGVYGIACQIFMPYLIIYMKTYLHFSVMEYSVVFGLAIVLGAVINLFLGGVSDRMDKTKALYLAAAVFVVGLGGMYFAHFDDHMTTLIVFGVAGFVMITGYIFVSALCGALVRDYTPEHNAGKLQGVRMIFSVLLPMLFGPMIGNAINKSAGVLLQDGGADLMTTQYIPAPGIFLAGALVGVLLFALIPVLTNVSKRRNGGQTKQYARLKTAYEVGEFPHDEHPAPQAKREQWLCLNGKWRLQKMDKQGRVLYDGEILVPFSPETLNSGVEEGFILCADEKLVYEREVQIDSAWNNCRAVLHFGAVDSQCQVFVNGVKVGEHKGGFTAFSCDITAELKEGGNHVRVECMDTATIDHGARGKQNDQRGGIWYTPQSGIWQTVWLEGMPKQYVRDIKITPNAEEKKVTIAAEGGDLELIVYDEGREIIREKFSKEITLAYDFTLWSPECPKLYDFTLTNEAGDCVQSYFGVRSFGKAKDEQGIARLTLNGKPYFFNGVLDQGYWSDGMLTYPSDQAAYDELKMLKDMGFNTVRKHIKIEPMRWYYHCDKLGLIVWQDFVNGGGRYAFTHVAAFPFLGFHHKDDGEKNYPYFAREDKNGREEFAVMAQETLTQLYNCVCIGVWVPFNEGWGQFDSAKWTEYVREQDGTRIIDSVSGWHDQGLGKTDLKSLHTYYTPLKIPKDERPVVLSEFGGYSLKCEGHVFDESKEFGYKKFATETELTAAIEELYEEKLLLLIAQGLCGCIYTQVSDVEEEINGLVTYDRAVVKVPVEKMAAINQKINAYNQ